MLLLEILSGLLTCSTRQGQRFSAKLFVVAFADAGAKSRQGLEKSSFADTDSIPGRFSAATQSAFFPKESFH